MTTILVYGIPFCLDHLVLLYGEFSGNQPKTDDLTSGRGEPGRSNYNDVRKDSVEPFFPVRRGRR